MAPHSEALVGRCPLCNVMFFACSKRAIKDAGEEIALLRDMRVKLEWVSGEAVRLNFEGACNHIKTADQMRSKVADWDSFWRILDIMDTETSWHDDKPPSPWEELLNLSPGAGPVIRDRLRPPWEKLLELSPGTGAVIRERLRQIRSEGFDSEHDAEHTDGELAFAAAAYAAYPDRLYLLSDERPKQMVYMDAWPDNWRGKWDKRGRGSELDHKIKAAALMIAEVDRLIRKDIGE